MIDRKTDNRQEDERKSKQASLGLISCIISKNAIRCYNHYTQWLSMIFGYILFLVKSYTLFLPVPPVTAPGPSGHTFQDPGYNPVQSATVLQ